MGRIRRMNGIPVDSKTLIALRGLAEGKSDYEMPEF